MQVDISFKLSTALIGEQTGLSKQLITMATVCPIKLIKYLSELKQTQLNKMNKVKVNSTNL